MYASLPSPVSVGLHGFKSWPLYIVGGELLVTINLWTLCPCFTRTVGLLKDLLVRAYCFLYVRAGFLADGMAGITGRVVTAVVGSDVLTSETGDWMRFAKDCSTGITLP